MDEVSKSSKPKVYQDVLEELRFYINDNHLSPGDKLPSERELAETLQAGRSSIREALRALELLGIIETRRGEGTFLRSYQSLQSVELLSSFILLQDGTKEDLLQAKRLLEKEALKLALPSIDEGALSELNGFLQESEIKEKHRKIFTFLLKKTGNQLLLKMWMLMEEFAQSINKTYEQDAFYHNLLEDIAMRDIYAIERLYEQQDLQTGD